MNTLTLTDLLARLGYTATEHVQVCTRAPGGLFIARTATIAAIDGAGVPANRDVWIGFNPCQPFEAGRANDTDITRLAMLPLDLDDKASGCGDRETAQRIIDTLTQQILKVEPAAVIASGHGLQPVWVLEDGLITDTFTTSDARALLRRWGRLARHIVETLTDGTAKIDSIFDLTRVLRCPGSINLKDPLLPVAVEIELPVAWQPISIDRLTDIFDAYGIPEYAGDGESVGEEVSPPAAWPSIGVTCRYVERMVAGWASDQPTARHPWLIGQATRLAAARRLGCVEDVSAAETALTVVFKALIATGPNARAESPSEISDALAWGVLQVAAMTEDRARRDLGGDNTPHLPHGSTAPVADAGDPFGTGLPPRTEDTVPDAETDPTEQPTRKHQVTLTPASTIKPRPVFWTWKGRLARGTLGLLAGREGLGKSTIGYWIAARLTRGQLPGIHHGAPKGVLICATEDSWEHTIVPRLMAAGANLNKIYRVEVITSGTTHGSLSLPRDLDALEASVEEADAALLILDPLMSRLDSALDTHRDGEVRLALEPMVAVADRKGMAILGVIHHNKSGSTDPLQLVMASKAFTAVARSVHTVIPNPDDDTGEKRMFGTPKNNLGRSDLPTLAFTIVGHSIDTDEGIAWTGRIEWGEEIADTIEETMRRAADDTGDRNATNDAKDWLADYMKLKGGTVKSATAKTEGKEAGHTRNALDNARKRLKLKVKSEGFPRVTWWSSAAVPPWGPPVEPQSSAPPRGDTQRETTETTRERNSTSDTVVSVVWSSGPPREDQTTGETTEEPGAGPGVPVAGGADLRLCTCGRVAELESTLCWRCAA